MKFVVKFFSEIAMKSKPVRKRFVQKLAGNIRAVLRDYDPSVVVYRQWDRLQIETQLTDEAIIAAMVSALRCTSGITYILAVREHPLGELHDLVDVVLPVYGDRLVGKTFAVRCKRTGMHNFRSIDVERIVGRQLMHLSDAVGVKLKHPEVTVEIEINGESVYVIEERHRGMGGFPMGSIDPVLSLISGGFDSPVASYLMMKRGMQTHFLFFNLGGRDHELGVKEVALYLWQKFGSKQRVLFISVPFEGVLAELLARVEDRQMGVILKRMMLRVADSIAGELDIDALVTGECVAQVSSQTIRNLSIIDRATDRLVFRPLIAADKSTIIDIATQIGTQEFAANMPEYCGVISINPVTRARLDRVEAEEQNFDMTILDRAVESAIYTSIDQLAGEDLVRTDVEVLKVPLAEATIIDIRHPDEEEGAPLKVSGPVMKIPFYELHSRAAGLSGDKTYLLYCGKGIMSKLHASYLRETGNLDVKVYAP
jgi:thiamine biosynthesis protein ThiI